MSAQTVASYRVFLRLLSSAEDLVEIHKSHWTGPGRRRQEMSLNRGTVVLTMAAWQTFVEGTVRALLDTVDPGPVGAAFPLFRLVRADVSGALGRFNTPNSRNTLELFQRLGLDPAPAWNFTITWPLATRSEPGAVIPVASLAFAPQSAKRELDNWLRVRHHIAHGDPFPSGDAEIESVLSGRTNSGPSIRRSDTERCISFIKALALATSNEADVRFP